MEADYVIVGAGAAGCVLAARLSEDPAVDVLLLEAGGRGRHPLLRVPKGFYLTMQRPAHAWAYATESGEWWLRGKGLGGSTAINGMMYVRGWAPDFDGLGVPEWSWPQMLAAYRAMEDHDLGASPLRGTRGPLHVSVPAGAGPVVSALQGAAAALGLDVVDDVNASDDDRVGPVPSTIRRGMRVDAASAFLRPARGRPNLQVLTGVRVDHVALDAGRASGVVADQGGQPLSVRARREVILAAGSIESPLLLERSGIGHPAVLQRAGIVPRVESLQVGERMLEHRAVTLRARLRPGLGLNRRLGSAPRQLIAGAGYLLTRRGPIATGPYDLVGQLRSDPAEPRPDVQILLTSMSTDPLADRLRLAPYAGLMMQGYQLRPTTTSSVHLRSPRSQDPPRISSRWLETEVDCRVTGRILDRLRSLLAAGPLAPLVVAEDTPGPDVATPDQVVSHARATGTGVYHAVGSCAMGPDDADVVDARLGVRGVPGLRVVDASVFPAMPSGNPAAPVMALAWRAAELILDEHRRRPGAGR